MIREYKTISEVVGPLMLVKDVDDVTYDELGEILLPSGEKDFAKSSKSTDITRWFSFSRPLRAST